MIHSLVSSLSLVSIFGIENQSSVFYVIIVIYPYTFIDKTLYSKGKKSVVKIEVFLADMKIFLISWADS